MTIDRASPQLTHLFAHGLRFDTEVQYTVQAPQRPSYRVLAIESDDGAGGQLDHDVTLLQCIAVLSQRPVDQIASIGFGKDKELRLADRRLALAEFRSSDTRVIGAAARQAIGLGHMGRVQILSGQQARWVLLVGVEMASGSSTPRALLVLDARIAAPWGMGHNARIELRAGLRGSTRCLRYRSLCGQAEPVALLGLTTVRRLPDGKFGLS